MAASFWNRFTVDGWSRSTWMTAAAANDTSSGSIQSPTRLSESEETRNARSDQRRRVARGTAQIEVYRGLPPMGSPALGCFVGLPITDKFGTFTRDSPEAILERHA